jgi:outer membrane lipoprotein-sorting protein
MKKRYWAIAIGILVLVLSLVSACGAPEASTPAATTPTATGTHPATGTPTATTPTATTPPTTATATTTTTATQPPTTTAGGSSLSDILGLGANVAHVYYEMSITTPGSETMVTKLWEKGRKYREEMTTQGMTTIIIMDMDAGEYYMNMSGTNSWIKMTMDTSMVPVGANEDPSSILQYNPQITGTETIDGKSCTVITYDMPGTGSITEWIWTEYGFPLKLETTTSEGTSTIEFTNIDFSDIPDSMFELPADAQVTEYGT